MAEIRPFHGIRYNQAIVKDTGAVMCPPHDVIPPQLQDELYHRSEYNFIRIEFGRELPQDNIDDNRYSRAAATMKEWLRQDVLRAEDASAIYIHDYYFTRLGKTYKRRGIMARVRLEEWSKKVIYPHEGTLSKSKNDRLSLLWACQANTSPILAMFQDSEQQIVPLLIRETRKKPVIETKSIGSERHIVWAITEPAVIDNLRSYFTGKPLYIADGHHRYESALMYKHEREAQASAIGEEGYNYVMMTLVEFTDPGLLILPPHRMVRGLSKSILSTLAGELGAFFDVKDLSLNDKGLWQKADATLTGGLEGVRIGLYGPDKEKLLILELKKDAPTGSLMPAFHTEIYKKLDVSIVDHIILEKLLGLSAEGAQNSLAFIYDKQEAVDCVRDGEFQLAILLNPVKAEVIKAIADAGDRMPRKSTYFYPKEPAGLVFNRFE